jgi:hypothetical protein
MQTDRQFRVSGNWALASDGLQWVLQRRGGGRWNAVSFVRSTKAVLTRCMSKNEKGVPPADAARLLALLPDTFDEWIAGPGRAAMKPNSPEGHRGSSDDSKPAVTSFADSGGTIQP